MSSEQRSNSAVRNLRSIFENKSTESSESRGRSPGSLSDLDLQRPRSKIRANFIPVEPTMAALAAEQNAVGSELTRESSAGLRRTSFSDGQGGDALKAARETLNTEQERRENESSVSEVIPETAVETPALESNKVLGGEVTQKSEKQAANPDKHVTGVEEEPATLTPADPTNEDAVSGGQAQPANTEDLRKPAKPSSSRSKPASISTRGESKASSSIKSPASQPKTPVSATLSQKAPVKKASRSSLTAPTAASVARSTAADKAAAAKSSSVTSKPKPKPREVTKPLEVSSRLTAPTAATRARQESASSTAKAPATATRPKPTTSARATPRHSLARPESRSSQTSGKKSTGPVDGSFLERMMRPTAASTSRTHEKPEAQTPPKKSLASRTKVNSHPPASARTAPAATEDVSAVPAPAPAPEADAQEEELIAPEPNDATPEPEAEKTNELAEADLDAKGNETPVHTDGDHGDAAVLESTPAALGEDEIIR